MRFRSQHNKLGSTVQNSYFKVTQSIFAITILEYSKMSFRQLEIHSKMCVLDIHNEILSHCSRKVCECILATSNLFDADCITTNLEQSGKIRKTFYFGHSNTGNMVKRMIQVETVCLGQLQIYSKICVSNCITTNMEAPCKIRISK